MIFAHTCHFFAYNLFIFTAVYYFLYDCYTMYLYTINGLFSFWPITSIAAINIVIHFFWWLYVFISFRHLEVELLGHRTDEYSVLVGTLTVFQFGRHQSLQTAFQEEGCSREGLDTRMEQQLMKQFLNGTEGAGEILDLGSCLSPRFVFRCYEFTKQNGT